MRTGNDFGGLRPGHKLMQRSTQQADTVIAQRALAKLIDQA